MARFYYNSLENNSLPKVNGTASSLITVLDACLIPSGWTKPFTGTNIAVYRSGTGSNQRYYRFEDAGTTTAGLRNCKLRMYDTMTDATDTGTNQTPLIAQQSQGAYIRKSGTADSVNREWIAVVTEKICYLFINYAAVGYMLHIFGDFESYKSLENKNSLISSWRTDSATNNTLYGGNGYSFDNSLSSAFLNGNYLAGLPNDTATYDTNTGLAGSVGFGFIQEHQLGSSIFDSGNDYIQFNLTKSFKLTKVEVRCQQTNYIIRGYLDGLYHLVDDINININTPYFEYENKFYIDGVLTTKKLLAICQETAVSNFIIEI